MKNRILTIALILMATWAMAQKNKPLTVKSPNGKLNIEVSTTDKVQWSVKLGKQTILEPSNISLHLENQGILGEKAQVASSKVESVSTKIDAHFYKKDEIDDVYNQLTINFKGNYSLVFRAYNDGAAYRFETNIQSMLTVLDEEATFQFTDDYTMYIPYVNDPVHDQFQISFENLYEHLPFSKLNKDTLAFAPILIELPNNVKVGITEADLEDYPGMFLKHGKLPNSLVGEFAAYPTEEKQGGHNNLQALVLKRANYLAKTNGRRNFPWRVLIVSEKDADLLNNDMVYKLAAPSRINDVSWIQPGKVAWDWWNDWNISGVDFRAGINTETYKYYIDFAAQYKIENILLDEGWANSLDIMEIIPEIDLQAIIDYAKSKGVGVWLWGGWYPLDNKTDEAFSTYSKMGVKGFKVDFMNRDDQKMVNFYYRLAQKAAQYNLMLDFHGAYKPTGLQRTYPNVVNFEGVRGMENAKWSNPDFPKYDCTIPFIRQLAGPMDYTPGAMKNANKHNFRAVHSAPMSQGTRCHQLAMYVLFEAPFNMLADNPTNYMREPESTRFIASIPTVFDETIALDGKVAEFAAVARRKGSDWFVGAITNWDARTITIDFSFLTPGQTYKAEIFRDGINADREATDYKREAIEVTSTTKLKVNLSTGGGWAAKISK